jgi:hypothetical protein
VQASCLHRRLQGLPSLSSRPLNTHVGPSHLTKLPERLPLFQPLPRESAQAPSRKWSCVVAARSPDVEVRGWLVCECRDVIRTLSGCWSYLRSTWQRQGAWNLAVPVNRSRSSQLPILSSFVFRSRGDTASFHFAIHDLSLVPRCCERARHV